MVEYIEREALLAEFYKKFCAFCPQEKCEEPCKLRIIKDAITSIPAADVREVVRGKWVFDCERQMHDGWTYRQYHCTECGFQMIGGIHNFCPNCGADMRGEEK